MLQRNMIQFNWPETIPVKHEQKYPFAGKYAIGQNNVTKVEGMAVNSASGTFPQFRSLGLDICESCIKRFIEWP